MKKQNATDDSKILTEEEIEERAVKSAFQRVRGTANQMIIAVLFIVLVFSLIFFCGGDLRYGGYKNNTRPLLDTFQNALPQIVDSIFFASFSTFFVKLFINIEMMRQMHGDDEEDTLPLTLPLGLGICLAWSMCYGMIYMCVRPIYSISEAIVFGIFVLLTWLISL